MTATELPAPPRLRPRAVGVGFVLAVGAILNCMSELGSACYVAWMVLAIPVLALLAAISAWQAAGEFGRARNAHALARGWQLALTVGAIVLLPLQGEIHDLVGVAKVRSRLHAEAWNHPDQPGPHVAVVQTGEFLFAIWGYVYDDSGEIEKPCGTQSDLWLQRAGEARLGNFDYCSASVSHVIGPYYSWGER
jgi:hypothetical protein